MYSAVHILGVFETLEIKDSVAGRDGFEFWLDRNRVSRVILVGSVSG
jgi:hypothetical protein